MDWTCFGLVMTQNTFDSRRWVLPLASIIPFAAIAYAFSLGPSPRAQYQPIIAAEPVDVAKLSALTKEYGMPVLAALTEDIQFNKTPHREELIKFLGDQGYSEAGWVLSRLATTDTETTSVRAAALRAYMKLQPNDARPLAERLRCEAGPLGEAAEKAIAELSSDQN